MKQLISTEEADIEEGFLSKIFCEYIIVANILDGLDHGEAHQLLSFQQSA